MANVKSSVVRWRNSARTHRSNARTRETQAHALKLGVSTKNTAEHTVARDIPPSLRYLDGIGNALPTLGIRISFSRRDAPSARSPLLQELPRAPSWRAMLCAIDVGELSDADEPHRHGPARRSITGVKSWEDATKLSREKHRAFRRTE